MVANGDRSLPEDFSSARTFVVGPTREIRPCSITTAPSAIMPSSDISLPFLAVNPEQVTSRSVLDNQVSLHFFPSIIQNLFIDSGF